MLEEIIEILGKKLWSPNLVEVIDEKVVLVNGAYTAEDVVSENISIAAGAKPWTFRNIAKRKGGGGYIVGGLITAQTTAIASQFTLFLFNAQPTCELGDGVTNTAVILDDRKASQGQISFTTCSDLGTGMSGSEAVASTLGKLPKAFVCAPASTDIYGVLCIHNAVDLADSTILTIKLYVDQY